MLITEMIKQLEELRKKHGDLEVLIPQQAECYLYGWTPVKFINFHENVKQVETNEPFSYVSIDAVKLPG